MDYHPDFDCSQKGIENGLGGENNFSKIIVISHWRKIFFKILAILGGISIPAIYPIVHMTIYHLIWSNSKLRNSRWKDHCTCSCWDAIYKAPHETGTPNYKNLYFNATSNTLLIWTITVITLVVGYECFKKIINLWISGYLRFPLVLVFAWTMHSNYYAWWVHFNYLNDEFYDHMSSQSIFTITEIISSSIIFYFLDRRRPFTPLPLIVLMTISILHIVHNDWEQMLAKKLLFRQAIRYTYLLSSDAIQVWFAVTSLGDFASENGLTFEAFMKKYLTLILFTYFIIWIFL